MTREDAIRLTRLHFVRLNLDLARDAKRGLFPKHNDPIKMSDHFRSEAKATLSGRDDDTFTFRQYAHFLMTGNCVPFTPA